MTTPLKHLALAAQLAAMPTDTGTADMINIAVIDGRIDQVIVYVQDQIRVGCRPEIVQAIGEDLTAKIELL